MSSHARGDWIQELGASVTVTDEEGRIVEMNAAACATFAGSGGEALVGRDLLDCHPGASREKVARLFEARVPSHYTISKGGARKIIHQLPFWKEGRFAGFVEISIPIPEDLPHFDRG
jgi:transcriptional regulator with PAS, ATPase and Fis domain